MIRLIIILIITVTSTYSEEVASFTRDVLAMPNKSDSTNGSFSKEVFAISSSKNSTIPTAKELSLYIDSTDNDSTKILQSQSGVTLKATSIDLLTAVGLLSDAAGFKLRVDTVLDRTVSVDIENQSLPDALGKLITENGYNWSFDHNTIVVNGTHEPRDKHKPVLHVIGGNDYRIFTINYPRIVRRGKGSAVVSVTTNESGEVGNVRLSNEDEVKFWEELKQQITAIAGDNAKLTINTLAGSIYLKADRETLNTVQQFLELVVPASLRQVEITARIYDVKLNDDNALGIDWTNISGSVNIGGTNLNLSANTKNIPQNNSDTKASTTGINLLTEGGNFNVVVDALKEQGNIQVLSQPKILTLNNQPALVKIGTDIPYFSVTQTTDANTGDKEKTEEVTVITSGVILSVTPQISADARITLGIDPIITEYLSSVTSQNGSTAPIVEVKQSSSIVTIHDRETIVISGLIHTKLHKISRKVPLLGDIPIIGALFSWHYEQKEKRELVIFITPKILN